MRRSIRNATLLAVAASAFALTGWACKSKDPAAPAPAVKSARKFPVEIATARIEPLAVRIEATGGLEAEDWVQVTAQVEGVLGPLEFREGDRVNPKTTLVDIDPERYRVTVSQKAAALSRAEAEHRDKEAGLTKRTALRQREPGWVPDEEISTWETQVAQSRAAVEEARAGLDLAKLDLERACIRPPIEGVIEKREATPGQYVKPGTVIASIVRTKPIRVRFSLREAESALVRDGTPIEFTVPAYPGERFPAEVFFVARSADPASRRVDVIARHPNDDERLKPGFFAQISVDVGSRNDAILLPESAVLATEDGFVGYVVESGKARKRVLDIGLQAPDGRIEIKRGVTAGETVVIKGAGSLLEGAEVVVAGS